MASKNFKRKAGWFPNRPFYFVQTAAD